MDKMTKCQMEGGEKRKCYESFRYDSFKKSCTICGQENKVDKKAIVKEIIESGSYLRWDPEDAGMFMEHYDI